MSGWLKDRSSNSLSWRSWRLLQLRAFALRRSRCWGTRPSDDVRRVWARHRAWNRDTGGKRDTRV